MNEAEIDSLAESVARAIGARPDLVKAVQGTGRDDIDDAIARMFPPSPMREPARERPMLLPETTRYFKAYENWTNVSGNDAYVRCYMCSDRSGNNVGTTSFDVYLHRNGSSEDPNVRTDAVLLACQDPMGKWVAVNPNLDGTINKTVKIWLDKDNIPGGWALAYAGRYFVGYDSTDADYNAVGDKAFGGKTFTLPPHAPHHHDLTLTTDIKGGSPDPVVATLDAETSGPSEQLVHAETDNRPTSEVVCWIKRTS